MQTKFLEEICLLFKGMKLLIKHVYCNICSYNKTGVILLLSIDGIVLHRLRGHDEDIHSIVWCPVSGENFKKAPKPYVDYDDPFGPGKYKYNSSSVVSSISI